VNDSLRSKLSIIFLWKAIEENENYGIFRGSGMKKNPLQRKIRILRHYTLKTMNKYLESRRKKIPMVFIAVRSNSKHIFSSLKKHNYDTGIFMRLWDVSNVVSAVLSTIILL
jgi:hypothetical protein